MKLSHSNPFRLAVMAGLLISSSAPAFAHKIEKSFPVGEHAVVTVRNSNGRINVHPWTKQEIKVVADHASDKVETDAEQVGNRVDVTTHLLSEKASAADLRADFEISVPAETELQIRNDSGVIIVKGISGDMSFDTVAADVNLEEVAGYVIVKTIGGSLECLRCAGRLDVTSISGNIRFAQPVSSNVRAKTHSGSIFFDGDFMRGGVYNLNSFEGLIEVRFSDTDSFSLNANSVKGKVDNQATLRPPTHNRRVTAAGVSSNSLLQGSFNDGLARVDLSSFSGTIRILKRQ
ncbi:MAG: hypothetical protein HY046_01055 [Acidobacteria bacterium]|nr:hypothetical protein [Acidobacteriota bacterium]